MSDACIVGWAHTPFGKLEDPDVESLIGRVARAAIEDAGVAPRGRAIGSIASDVKFGFDDDLTGDQPASG